MSDLQKTDIKLISDYLVKIVIKLPQGDDDGVAVCGMYLDTTIIGDLDQTAWNMCGCDEEKKASQFGITKLVSGEARRELDGQIVLEALLRISSTDPVFIKSVFDEYINGFQDWIYPSIREYQSHEGIIVKLDSRPMGWDIQVTPN